MSNSQKQALITNIAWWLHAYIGTLHFDKCRDIVKKVIEQYESGKAKRV